MQLAVASVDVNRVRQVLDQEWLGGLSEEQMAGLPAAPQAALQAGQAPCPACGTVFAMADGRCPDCGLNFS